MGNESSGFQDSSNNFGASSEKHVDWSGRSCDPNKTMGDHVIHRDGHKLNYTLKDNNLGSLDWVYPNTEPWTKEKDTMRAAHHDQCFQSKMGADIEARIRDGQESANVLRGIVKTVKGEANAQKQEEAAKPDKK